MHQEIERIDAMMRRRDGEAADRVIELDGFTAMLIPGLPDVWDANWLQVNRPGQPIEAIVAAADETIGAAGLAHRTVLSMDADDGERLIAELEPRGWDVERNIYMALHREPDRPASPEIVVDEVGLAEVEESRREFLRHDLADFFDEVTDAILDQFIAADRRYGEVAGDRWFAAREDGKVVNFCRLFSYEGIGQVEDVATLPEARNRGLARATVLAAIDASRTAGHDLIFLGALTEDWPRKLYARLGFDQVGVETVLYRKPGRQG